MRYSLKRLFAAATGICFALSMWAWLDILGLLVACGMIGCILGAHGLIEKQTRQSLLGFGIAAVVTAVFCHDMSGERIWDGQFTSAFDVTVVDADTNAPIPDAKLVVGMRAWEMETYPITPQGKSKFSHTFPCGGHDSILGITRSSWNEIPLGWYQLTVRTSDGAEQRFPLDELMGRTQWPMGDSSLPPITIRVDKLQVVNADG